MPSFALRLFALSLVLAACTRASSVLAPPNDHDAPPLIPGLKLRNKFGRESNHAPILSTVSPDTETRNSSVP